MGKVIIPYMTGELKVPSGQIFNKLDFRILELMAKYKFIRLLAKPARLISGVESMIYVSGREELTDHPDLEWLIGRKIARFFQKLAMDEQISLRGGQQLCLIGVPTAATPLAQAASMASQGEGIYINHNIICHRVMREKLKDHGEHLGWVNGFPNINHFYILLEGAITTGKSVGIACQRISDSSYPDMPVVILIDRQQGGLQNLQARRLKAFVIYNFLDIVFAFDKLGLWPEDMVQRATQEINENQF